MRFVDFGKGKIYEMRDLGNTLAQDTMKMFVGMAGLLTPIGSLATGSAQ